MQQPSATWGTASRICPFHESSKLPTRPPSVRLCSNKVTADPAERAAKAAAMPARPPPMIARDAGGGMLME